MSFGNSAQIFRYLKAYNKIINQPIMNLDNIAYKLWINDLNIFYINENNSDNNILFNIELPSIPDCPKPPALITEYLDGDINNFNIDDISLDNPLNQHDQNNNPCDKQLLLLNEFNKWVELRKKWLHKYKEKIRAFNAYTNLEKLKNYTKRTAQKRLLLANGILNLSSSSCILKLPLLLQPISLKKKADGHISVHRAGKVELNISALTAIPNISPKSIEKSLELFSKYNFDLPGNSGTEEFLASLFRFTTEGNNNLISIKNAPVFFAEPLTSSYDYHLTNGLQDQTSFMSESALEKTLNTKHLDNSILDFNEEYLFYHKHKESSQVLQSLAENGLALVNALPGTEKEKVIVNTVLNTLSKGGNVLVTSPFADVLSSLINNMPTDLQEIINTCQSPKQSSINIHEIYQERENVLLEIENKASFLLEELLQLKAQQVADNSRKNNVPIKFSESISAEDILSLFWKKDFAYCTEALQDLLGKLKGILLDEFTSLPWTKNIADQYKMVGNTVKWNNLIKKIDSYLQCKNSFSEVAKEHNIEITNRAQIKDVCYIINELVLFTERKGPLTLLDYIFNKTWKSVIDNCYINKRNPKSYEDFVLIQKLVEVYYTQEQVALSWNNLLVPLGLPFLSTTNSSFDKIISVYYQPLINSINWYSNHWEHATKLLESNGFLCNAFFDIFNQQYIEKGFVNMLKDDALPTLITIIEHKIKYITNKNKVLLNCNLTYNTFYDSTKKESINIVDLTPCLKQIIELKQQANLLNKRIIQNSSHGCLNCISWANLMNNNIRSPYKYELIIIDSAEYLDVFGAICLSFAKKALIFGDEGYSPTIYNTETNETVERLNDSLLSAINIGKYLNGAYTLYEIIKQTKIAPINLKANKYRNKDLICLLNNLFYQNKLQGTVKHSKHLLPALISVPLNGLNIVDSITTYLNCLLTSLNSYSDINNLTIGVVDLTEGLFLDNLFYLKNRKNYTAKLDIGTAKNFAKTSYDIIVIVDDDSKCEHKEPLHHNIQYQKAISAAREMVIYVHPKELELQQSDSIKTKIIYYANSLSNKTTNKSNEAALIFQQLIKDLADLGFSTEVNHLVCDNYIDLAIFGSSNIALLNPKKTFTPDTIKWLRRLSEDNWNIVFIKSSENQSEISDQIVHYIKEHKIVPNARLVTKKSLNELIKQSKELFNNHSIENLSNQNYLVNEVAITNDQRDISFTEINLDKNLLRFDSSEKDNANISAFDESSNTYIDSLEPQNTTNEQPTLVHFSNNKEQGLYSNRVAQFNFLNDDKSTEDNYIQQDVDGDSISNKSNYQNTHSESVDNSVVSSDTSNIIDAEDNKQHESINKNFTSITSDRDIYQHNLLQKMIKSLSKPPNKSAFDPDKDTYKNLFLYSNIKVKDEIHIKEAPDFDLIKWLEKNDYEYVDLSPDNKLWVIDKPDMRHQLRKLRIYGLNFALHVKGTEATNYRSAWCLINKREVE